MQVKGKKPKNETSSDNVDEGSISLRTEVKQDKRRGRRSADNDKKKKKKSCGAEGRRNSAPTGYVYVRARRGQATDSHSLAERVHILLLISHDFQIQIWVCLVYAYGHMEFYMFGRF